ncbi:MAG TPA: IS110 family transposase [Dehalococcoidia bacterium]|nr:IS110 family transposase [Dehalococcoidia bacterium]
MSANQNTIFVGMDVHKAAINVAVAASGRREPEAEWQLANEPRAVKKLMKKLKEMTHGTVMAAYEAGPCGYTLQRQMCEQGIDCIVVAPSLIPVKPGEHVKTDRRDARRLASLLQAGLLTEVCPPTPEDESVRDLTRAREDVKQDQMRARHRLGKMLLRHGFVFRDGKNWTKRHREWLRQVRLGDGTSQLVFEGYVLTLEQVEERLKRVDEQLEEVAQSERYRKQVGWLRCLRGIDTVTAMALLAELHDFRRFTNPRELMSFLGMTPSEHTSSSRVRRGSITKAGNTHVRRVLIEAAHHYRHRPSVNSYVRQRRNGQPAWVLAIADRAQERLHSRYFKLKEGYKKPHNVAVVAVARELVGFVWAVLRHGESA